MANTCLWAQTTPSHLLQRSEPSWLPALKDERPTRVAFFEYTQAAALSGAKSVPISLSDVTFSLPAR
ncbi:hypothetical protein KSB_69540 [Ktedonobacter robiniae]|uniref:Uncharacterized protein n=1 Tax=Ktedonobacter robiniae TaxID=2778365 RepID=A0ABQ3V0R5_9CHLR|nr:hypothetical protein KSB_69540 [Ktedonobacter robiniae]